MQKFGILMSVVLCLPLSLVAQVGGAMPAGSAAHAGLPNTMLGLSAFQTAPPSASFHIIA